MNNVFLKGLFLGIVSTLLIFALISALVFGSGYARLGEVSKAVAPDDAAAEIDAETGTDAVAKTGAAPDSVPDDAPGGEESLLESGGYASAELAVRSYLEGYKTMDLEKAISAFAVETFVDNYNFKAQVGNDAEFSTILNSNLAYPNKTRLLRQDNIYQRLSQVERGISEQLIGYTEPDFGGITADDMETMELDPLYDMIYNAFPDDSDFEPIKSLSVKRFLSPDEMGIAKGYDGAEASNYINMAKETYGIDELSDTVALCGIDGREYYLTFIAFRYDDRWFIGEIGETPGLILTDAQLITTGIYRRSPR